MEEEIFIRKQAVKLHLENMPIKDIAEKLGRSRQWVHKWINRYRSEGGDKWFYSRSKAPKNIENKTAANTEELVIKVRKALEDRIYSQTGALSIMYEVERMGINPPSLSTINRILKRHDLIHKSRIRQKKGVEYPNHFFLVQQMDLVGPRYLTGGSRFYFQNIIDTENHYVGVYPIKDKRSITIARSIAQFWSTYGTPDFLQMDNELSFRGSNRYPRSLGIVLRFALSKGVTPIFIPPSEPWRNGMIEKFNYNLQKYFFSSHRFTSFEDVKEKATQFADYHNHHHRYSTQKGKLPTQIKSIAQEYKLSPSDLNLGDDDSIPLISGSVVFIRFIRSDRNLTILGTRFLVNKKLIYTYVIAEIVIDQHVLLVKQDEILYHVFPFVMPVDE